MNIPNYISESLEIFFYYKYPGTILIFFDADSDLRSGIFLTPDPGWKNSDPEPGIKVPQHWV
jgi:hypothetical protein